MPNELIKPTHVIIPSPDYELTVKLDDSQKDLNCTAKKYRLKLNKPEFKWVLCQ